MTEVESPAVSASFRDEQSGVLAVEVEDAKSPALRIVVGEEHPRTSAKQVLSRKAQRFTDHHRVIAVAVF
jgi:hypothetical protein